ncbi:MAG: 4-hydroxyphenylacetate 3-hydroxylase family protein [Synergistaceae bacterium]|jgi:4-hydroxybutyryl-CoA dehydratase/vinylacetyl-CoA-Delta-isomerase|nr:4-hydroxyphenylacetate 3-hydroxylase family protein [Synergistaceae bacterium]
MKNKAQYIESLRKLKPVIYHMGKRVESVPDYPQFIPHVNSVGLTYDLALSPEGETLLSAWSPYINQKINRFTHIHENPEDLVKKVKALRLLGQKTGACFQRCVGWDALNTSFSTTWEMDKKLGTEYHPRFKKFLEYVQKEDLMLSGSMTDVKGDRSLKPSQQADPDLFVHIVEKNDKGILVRGAKAHMTGMVNSHEMLVMPTMSLTEEDRDYAVSFAIPIDTKGVVHVFGRQTNDSRRFEPGSIDKGNVPYGMVGGECLTMFNDVFVPWERVFMCGEVEFAGMLVERFATWHRQNYGGCKTGVADVIIGAAAALSRYNGAESASHIRDKLVEMTFLTEDLYCASIACSTESFPTPSGVYLANPMLANIVKQSITRNIYEICRIAQDISGGLLATMPSEADINNPETGPMILKYLKGRADVPAETRIRMFRLMENLTGGTALAESMHGAGSPQAQRIMIYRNANLKHKIKLAEFLSGVSDEEA